MNAITKKLGMLGAGAIMVGLALAAPTAAQASVQGRENTAIALGLGTVYALSQHNDGAAAVLGIGTAVAAQQYEQARHDQSVCENGRTYYYNDGWDRDRDRDNNRSNDDHRGGYQFGEGSWSR